MSGFKSSQLNRRTFVAAAVATVATGATAQTNDSTEVESDVSQSIRRNISSFRSLEWQPYFENTRNGAILVDIQSRALHFWSEDQSIYKLYPTSVPLTDDLTRRGRTQVTDKVVAPAWRPTPSMRAAPAGST